MKIVHFSDWHGHFRELPEADLYICTGDMYPNFPTRIEEPSPYPYHDPLVTVGISRPHEERVQSEWARNFCSQGGMARYLGSPSSPVVCVRGNHDFIDLAAMFDGCDLAHEFILNEEAEVLGLTITGHRGIPYIFGTWNDEVHDADLMERVRSMPTADIFLTHYAPAGILDVEWKRERRLDFGLKGMVPQLWTKGAESPEAKEGMFSDEPTPLDAPIFKALHCFGHIHGSGGNVSHYSGFVFSNASCTYNVIEF